MNPASAKEDLPTLYVSLEPCNHHGRTPPCTEAIIDAGIPTVVFGCTDPHPLVSGAGIARLQQAGIKVRGPVEEIGLPEQARSFFIDRRQSWALMGADEWETVRPLYADMCVADRRPLSVFDARLTDVLHRRLPAEVLLIRNHCR